MKLTHFLFVHTVTFIHDYLEFFSERGDYDIKMIILIFVIIIVSITEVDESQSRHHNWLNMVHNMT